MNKRGQAGLLQYYEMARTFVNEEKDTPLGLLVLMLIGLGIVKYLILNSIVQLQNYSTIVMPLAGIVIFVFWLNFRRLKTERNKFNIAISSFDVLVLDTNHKAIAEHKRDFRKELADYVYSCLHFNKEQLELEKYINIIRLPSSLEVNQKTAREICRKLGVDILIWGNGYFKEGHLYFQPKFEFLQESANIYQTKFKKNLNSLKTFKIDVTKNLEKGRTNLSGLLHYLSFLGLMFHGIHLTHLKKFEESQDCFELVFKTMKNEPFSNRSVSDIYLATRFFYAQNLHKWGDYLSTGQHGQEVMELYDKAANSFLAVAIDEPSLDKEEKPSPTKKQVYSPELLEEESRKDLSLAFLEETDALRRVLEKIAAQHH